MTVERDDRIAEIEAASRRHPVVNFALSTLTLEGDTLRPNPTLAEKLTEKLAALQADELLSATLGLVDLAFILEEKHGSPEANEAIIAALKTAESRIVATVKDLPGGDKVLVAMAVLGNDAFGGKKRKTAEPPRGTHVSNSGFDLCSPAPPKKKP